MKYNEGDKVRIKSKEWYDTNKDEYGNVHFNGEYGWMFTERDSRFCGKVVTILCKGTTSYEIVEDSCEGFWTDEMIEGLVEEETEEVNWRKIADENAEFRNVVLKIAQEYFPSSAIVNPDVLDAFYYGAIWMLKNIRKQHKNQLFELIELVNDMRLKQEKYNTKLNLFDEDPIELENRLYKDKIEAETKVHEYINKIEE